MGCFLACFGGDANRRRRRQKSQRQSPARTPPRSIHVAVAREAADVVVKEVSPPLRGANPSTLAEAVEAPQDEVAEDADVAAKDASLPSHEVKASTPPPAVAAADEAVTDASPVDELRDLTEQKVLEKQAAPSLSPVKCSPIVAAVVSPHDSVKCSPVVAGGVSALDSELREVSEHGSRSSGKKKVTFDMNIRTYENAVPLDQEEEPPEEDENYVQNTVVLPENHRYRNCSDSDDDDVGDEYAEDDVYGDEDEEDSLDCKIDLVDEEELRTEENKQESHESLFSLSMSNDQKNDPEVVSPAPKSSGTSVEAESPLITTKKLRDRCQYVHPVLNPVQNLSQWKEVKSLKAQPVHGKMLDKENVNSVADVGPSHDCNSASHTRMNPSLSSKKENSLDASLSTWLVSSENSAVDNVQSKSPCSISSVHRGALTVDDLKQSSTPPSPQRSPRTNREGSPMLGTVGSYWYCTEHDNEYCSSRSNSGTTGIPNSTSKYREVR